MLFLDLGGEIQLPKQDCEHFHHTVDISDQEESGRSSNMRPSGIDDSFQVWKTVKMKFSVVSAREGQYFSDVLASVRAPMSFCNLYVFSLDLR